MALCMRPWPSTSLLLSANSLGFQAPCLTLFPLVHHLGLPSMSVPSLGLIPWGSRVSWWRAQGRGQMAQGGTSACCHLPSGPQGPRAANGGDSTSTFPPGLLWRLNHIRKGLEWHLAIRKNRSPPNSAQQEQAGLGEKRPRSESRLGTDKAAWP